MTTSASVSAQGWTWIVRGNATVSETGMANFSHLILAFTKLRSPAHLPVFGETRSYGVALTGGVIPTGDEIPGLVVVGGMRIQFAGGTAGLTIMHAWLTVIV